MSQATRQRRHREISPTTRAGTGAIAGVVATTVFTIAHHLFINPIWWAFPFMALAGAACGAALTWCYVSVVSTGSGRSWTLFVGLFTVMFGLLAAVSMMIYEPIITMEEVVNSTGGNPIPISESLGLMIPFTIAWAALMALSYRAGWRGFTTTLAATTVLMLFLGINVSTAGLVEIPTTGWKLVAEFFGYIAALGASFGITYHLIEVHRAPTTRTLRRYGN